MHTFVIDTPMGGFTAQYSELGLARLRFPGRTSGKSAAEKISPAVRTEIGKWHGLVERALRALLAGRAPGKFPPFDLEEATDFQRAVWRGMSAIPWGQTSTYAGLARAIGRPRAVRAVGGACGANPIPVLIPCHRVLAAGNALGGFSSGLNWKRTLLAAEGWDAASGSSVRRKGE